MTKLHKEDSVWLVLGVILLVLAFIILGPVAIIWALNTLFPVLAIPYTFSTWLAASFILAAFGPNNRVKLERN
jgi:uncharacterized membrane protein YccF (DUF307 family)